MGGDPPSALAPSFENYLAAQTALANDDLATAKAEMAKLSQSLAAVDAKSLSESQMATWTSVSKDLLAQTQTANQASDIAVLRQAFGPISKAMVALAEQGRPEGVNKFFCPMALGHGAHWLAKGDEVLNPYYGASMLHCGAKQNF